MTDNNLATPSGFVNGLALGLAFWCGVVVTIVGVFVAKALGHG